MADETNNTGSQHHERDYLERTIETVRNHQHADNCWPQWANIFADEIERLWRFAEEIKKLASDPFASDTVALRACLLAANEALGLPGPQPSPERDIARAILKEYRDADA